jgi:hypothetical protein
VSEDASITCVAAICITKLVDRARDLDPEAVEELADRVADAIKRPDRRVGAALRIEPFRNRRDRIVRHLAGEGSLRKKASA